MKLKNLMINDWFCNKNDQSHKPFQIKKIDTKCVMDLDGCYSNIIDIIPIELTGEILENNGFKKDAFTNLSPDYFLENEDCSICINLKATCDKSINICIENRKTKYTIIYEISRHAFPKNPLYVHDLQHCLNICGIDKKIKL